MSPGFDLGDELVGGGMSLGLTYEFFECRNFEAGAGGGEKV